MKKLLVAMGVAAVIAILATTFPFFGYISTSRPPASAASIDAAGNTNVGVSNTLPGSTAALPPQSPSAMSPKSSLADSLKEAKDWRTFALEAIRRPSEGGYLYAMHVANLCGRDMGYIANRSQQAVRSIVVRDSTISSQTLDAIADYSTKCASFPPTEANEIYKKAKAASTNGEDPLVVLQSAMRNAISSHKSAEVERALENVLRSGDRMLLDDFLVEVVSMTAKGDTHWFDGTEYSGEEKRTVLFSALRLGSCAPEQYCALDQEMQIACSATGHCFETRENYVRATYFPGVENERAWSEVVSVSDRVRTIIEREDYRPFVTR